MNNLEEIYSRLSEDQKRSILFGIAGTALGGPVGYPILGATLGSLAGPYVYDYVFPSEYETLKKDKIYTTYER